MAVQSTHSPISARFSCNYCRKKKIKCSKDLPKCSACQPWPGDCDYSTNEKVFSRRRHRPSGTAEGPRRIETRLRTQTRGIEQSQAPEVDRDENDTPPSHSFSFQQVEKAFTSHGSPADRQRVHNGLQVLSAAVNTVSGDSEVNATGLKVPSRAAGYSMIGSFLEIAEMGVPFFSSPSEEVIRQVVFEPHLVREKAWIVYLNYMLLSARQDRHSQWNPSDLRHNVQQALNNSSIYLTPSHANIQTLAFLAMHGEEYASPQTSWLLLGHACRQAEALQLHQPASSDKAVNQQSLCLFWMLFMIDKSCALAFGRPAFLLSSLYSSVPLPTPEVLATFRPQPVSDMKDEQALYCLSRFGHLFLARGLELAKLTGHISEALISGKSTTPEAMLSDLQRWYSDTFQPLTETLRSGAHALHPNQHQEMALGINTLKFQYLHALTILLKDRPSHAIKHLATAREALSLLPSLVSNHNSVYNGVVWTLLYYPFACFFAVFEHIITITNTNTIATATIRLSTNGLSHADFASDLHLLHSTVMYYQNMRAQMRTLSRVCERLQHVASTFHQLAAEHVGRAGRKRVRIEGMVDSREETQVGVPDVVEYFEWRGLGSERVMGDVAATDGDDAVWSGGMEVGDGSFDWFAWDAYYSGNSGLFT